MTALIHVVLFLRSKNTLTIKDNCDTPTGSGSSVTVICAGQSGIQILKDIVFKRVKAYNLVQLFEFLTVTFELYYERRLLAVAHNRMDRYISLRYKGLGVAKVNQDSIHQSTNARHVYNISCKEHCVC